MIETILIASLAILSLSTVLVTRAWLGRFLNYRPRDRRRLAGSYNLIAVLDIFGIASFSGSVLTMIGFWITGGWHFEFGILIACLVTVVIFTVYALNKCPACGRLGVADRNTTRCPYCDARNPRFRHYKRTV